MKFLDGHTVGIDLGTTFSTIAYLDNDGEPVALPNDEGELETPSLILLAESGHVIVGPNRNRAAMEDPDNVVDRIKRDMGSHDLKRTFDGHEITPEFLSSLILKKLHQDAEAKIGKIGNAVVTVPYYFNDARRKATEDAGAIAGINVIDIINEPTAATLSYAWHRGELGTSDHEFKKPRLAVVYDLGGGTFDVTVVRYTPTHFQVLATDGDVHLGGVDWSDRIVDYVADEFKSRHGKDPRDSRATVQMLRNDCDQAKITLSDSDEARVSCRHSGKSISVTVTRDQFQQLTGDLLQRTLDTCDMVLDQAKLTTGDLDAIVTVGGSTLMPLVRTAIQQHCDMEPYAGLSPFTTVAQGAAIHAAILEAKHRGEKSQVAEKVRKHLRSIKQEEVNSHGLGVVAKHPKTGKMINHVMIKRNSQLPVEIKRTFKTNYDGQERVNVQITEGDAPDPAAVSAIGNCRIVDLPKDLPKGSPIEVTYSFDQSGRIHVRAMDKVGGREAGIQIERRSGLDGDQLDRFTQLAKDYQVE